MTLSVLPGDEIVYEALDKISDDPQDQLTYSEKFLNSQILTGMPLHNLHLKIGCIIMLFKNLAACQGLCNGTRLIVTKLQRNIEAKAIYSDYSQTFFIPHAAYDST